MRHFKPVDLLVLLLTAPVLSTMAKAQQNPPSTLALAEFSQPVLPPLANLSLPERLGESAKESLSEAENGEGVIRIVPPPPTNKKTPSQRPFHTSAFGIKANTLGAGAEIATPLAHTFNLRSGFNWMTVAYPFEFDGVNYNASLRLQSSQTTLDWFPGAHSFHISAGVLYARNAISSSVLVPSGQNFTFGGETFVNSVSDPVHGEMSVVFHHALSPLLLIGFGNILPRSHQRFSVPFELGAAYTGAATATVNLVGTACVDDNCFNFANDSNAQDRLNREVDKANEDLKRVPVYPILSLGVAYHF
jgi:hypothetical protein